MDLNKSKKTSGGIPTSILQLAANVIEKNISESINMSIRQCIFPDKLKTADIIPCHKKDDTSNKRNYRPISLLPTISKVFEKCLFNQISNHCQNILSPYLSGFRKGYSTQYTLLEMIKNWKNCLDNSGIIGTILMDLSKAFDCLSHELLIAKMEAYGFGINSLRLIFNYLKQRKHRVRIGSEFSDWLEMILGVPQGSILGPLLFNIFINDIFYFLQETKLCNFADDNTLYACDTTLEAVTIKLENELSNIITWFRNNSLVVNPDKFQVMFLGVKGKHNLCVDINGTEIKSSKDVKLLGVTIDSKLHFDSHVKNICKKANQKSRALIRIRNYLSLEKAKILCNAYIMSTFSYCPLIWMFHCKSINQLINRTHLRALRVVHMKYDDTFENLLSINNSNTIHVQNLQHLMTEVYKCIHKLNPAFMWEIFKIKTTPYNLRIGKLTKLPKTKTICYGINAFIFRGSILWNSVPNEIKEKETTQSFKRSIKTWNAKLCNCKICCS